METYACNTNKDKLNSAMHRGGSGYVTVNIGFGQHKQIARSHLDNGNRNRTIRRLRSEGWSYRHISIALNISYASVSQLLDGDEVRFSPVPLHIQNVSLPSEPNRPTANRHTQKQKTMTDTNNLEDRFDQLSGQITVVQQRLDRVIAMQKCLKHRLDLLEKNFISILQREHRALGQHLQNSMKTIFFRILPHPTDKNM